MKGDFPLGIQSYCFREFKTIRSLIDGLKKVNLPYVEIYPGHIDYHQDPKKTGADLAQIRDAGISVSAYGGVELKNDEADVRKMCELALKAGTHFLTVVTVDEKALPMLERLAVEYKIKYCIHNHGRGFQFGTFRQHHDFFAHTSKNFGLCLDAAWFLDSKEDPVAAVDEFADRLYGVHLKDFAFDQAGKPYDVIIGKGGLDLPQFMERLKKVSFGGYLSLEYEGNPVDPLAEVLECMATVRAAMTRQ